MKKLSVLLALALTLALVLPFLTGQILPLNGGFVIT